MGRRVVITGRDEETWRRLDQFLYTRARFTVFYEGRIPVPPRLINNAIISVHYRALRPDDLDGTFLLISTFGKGAHNKKFYRWTRERRVLMYAVDDIQHSDLILPAIGRKGLITVTVSTSGASPFFAVKLRDRFINQVDDVEVALVSFLGQIRSKVRRALSTYERRRTFYQFLFESDIRAYLATGDVRGAELRFCEILNGFRNREMKDER